MDRSRFFAYHPFAYLTLAATLTVSLAAKAANGLDAVAVYAGTWKTDTEHFATAHSKASHESSTLRNDCWRSGPFYACNQYVDGESKALIVYSYDAAAKTYTTYPILVGGGAAGSGKLLIDGKVWTYPWEDASAGATTYYRIVNTFTSPEHIDFRQEYSTDRVTWTAMARGTETKIR